jgi:poly-gamma-glutamate synthesis protein (capsule biosynthesis protein)
MEIMIPETTLAPTTVPTEPAEERFLLTFVGDCTFGANPTNTYAGYGFPKTVGEDYRYPFRNVIRWFENDEASFLNLEGPLSDVGNPMQKKHVFRGTTAFVNILTENSVEAVTIANNHTMDYGQIGYDSTVMTLQTAGIPFVEQDGTCIFTTENGLTIGLYGAVYYKLDTQQIVSAVASLKEAGCGLVIFAPHWGVEGSYRPTEAQRELAHAVIDAGADIVWGSHPHVLQPVEEYNDGMIFYSMGNFSFGGNGYPRDYDTALLQLEVIRTADGSVTLGELTIVPANVSSVADRNNYQPTPYEPGTAAYDRVLQKLDGTWTGPNLPIQ